MSGEKGAATFIIAKSQFWFKTTTYAHAQLYDNFTLNVNTTCIFYFTKITFSQNLLFILMHLEIEFMFYY